ncbi:MAG: Trp family transcriptional regulator [Candidatus Doudnabacteria bacterium]|jgi:TrpR family trp operon transcriptional repressor
MQYKTEYAQEFEKILTKLTKQPALLHEFLFDILSPAEYKDLAVRWQIIKLLKAGVTHREIAKKLKVSVATVTRGSRELANKKGGFQSVLNKFY